MDRTSRAAAASQPQGGGEGFERLFADEREPMIRMATLMVGSAEVAEEIVQDALCEISVRWASLDRPGGYLRRSVVHGCAAVLRRRSVEARYRRLDTEPPVADLPDRLVELRDALDRLSERQRIVVVLRYFVDIPDPEIAEAMGVRPATVRSLARRALASLRKELT
jgi:RNA polymerase sigma factor (sigma-70 family)